MDAHHALGLWAKSWHCGAEAVVAAPLAWLLGEGRLTAPPAGGRASSPIEVRERDVEEDVIERVFMHNLDAYCDEGIG